MKLLIYITNNTQHVYPILASMLEQHIGGATVVDCEACCAPFLKRPASRHRFSALCALSLILPSRTAR